MAYVYSTKKVLPDIVNMNVYYIPDEVVLIDDNCDRVYVGKFVDCITTDASLIQGKITNINRSGIDIKTSSSCIMFIPYDMINYIAMKKICVMED